MKTIAFIKLKMSGGRFGGHSIPLTVLKDLSVLEEFIPEVAKYLYLQDNKMMKRSPRGFLDGVSLHLADDGDGFSAPIIHLMIDENSLFALNILYFERARHALFIAIGAASHSENVHHAIPAHLLSYFDRFGRSLCDDESVEFSLTSSGERVVYDREVRKTFVLGSQAKMLTDDITLRGAVPEVDQEKMTFTVITANRERISAPVSYEHAPVIMETFKHFAENARIVLQGTGCFDRTGILKHIESIRHITSIEINDIFYQIEQIRTLQASGTDGPEKGFLDWLSEKFTRYYSKDLPWPYVSPTPEGGVILNWRFIKNEISLGIDSETKVGFYHELNMREYSVYSKNIDLSEVECWSVLNNSLLLLRGNEEEE